MCIRFYIITVHIYNTSLHDGIGACFYLKTYFFPSVYLFVLSPECKMKGKGECGALTHSDDH
jgi:hypothetical protein